MQYDLSFIIPARNEEFLKNTVEDILKNKRGATEVIVGLDGAWSDPPLEDHPDVNIIYYPKSIGQRAMMNRCVRLSRARYVCKVDAHCSFDEGWDVKMIDAFNELGEDDITMVSVMRNLWAFDWKCYKCGKRVYQDKESICPVCGTQMKKKMLWRAKRSPNSTSYRFNSQLEFKYFGEYKKKQEGDLAESMSLQGSCFMATRENYWEKELCDESWGSWGGQGAEVAIKTWLSGGRVICNKRTWYAHMFRTKQKTGFGFPYANPAREQKKAKNKLRDALLNNKWEKQVRPLSWLIEKFAPVPDWSDEDIASLKESETKDGRFPTS